MGSKVTKPVTPPIKPSYYSENPIDIAVDHPLQLHDLDPDSPIFPQSIYTLCELAHFHHDAGASGYARHSTALVMLSTTLDIMKEDSDFVIPIEVLQLALSLFVQTVNYHCTPPLFTRITWEIKCPRNEDTSAHDARTLRRVKSMFLRTLTGKTLTIQYDPHKETVLQLKRQIEDLERIPVSHQRLIVRGRQMQDEDLLSSYNVEHQTTHLVMRLAPMTLLRVEGVDPPPDPSWLRISSGPETLANLQEKMKHVVPIPYQQWLVNNALLLLNSNEPIQNQVQVHSWRNVTLTVRDLRNVNGVARTFNAIRANDTVTHPEWALPVAVLATATDEQVRCAVGLRLCVHPALCGSLSVASSTNLTELHITNVIQPHEVTSITVRWSYMGPLLVVTFRCVSLDAWFVQDEAGMDEGGVVTVHGHPIKREDYMGFFMLSKPVKAYNSRRLVLFKLR